SADAPCKAPKRHCLSRKSFADGLKTTRAASMRTYIPATCSETAQQLAQTSFFRAIGPQPYALVWLVPYRRNTASSDPWLYRGSDSLPQNGTRIALARLED